MNNSHTDLTDPKLPHAVEKNFAEEMAGFGRHLPGGTFYEDNEITWFMTAPNGPNGVLMTHFALNESHYIKNKITETIELFRAHQIQEVIWRIGPTSTPKNLSRHLEAHGLKQKAMTNCMLIHASQLRGDGTDPIGLTIKEVTTEEELHIKCAVEQEGFGSSTLEGHHYYQTYIANGFGEHAAWHHYIGWLNGDPAGVGALLIYSGIGGIYGITTLHGVRKQGIATAMTRHLVKEASRSGHPIVTLSNTRSSASIYRKLGFYDYCKLHHYRIPLR